MAIHLDVRKRPLWISGIIIAAALLFFAGAAVLWIWNIWLAHTPTFQTDIISAIFAVLGVVFTFLQLSPLLIPTGSIVGSEISLANKLSREDLKMGSDDDAYFNYVKTPIKGVYDSVTQALGKASKRGRRGKQGLLVLGEANAGKTRLIVEALTEILPKWLVFHVSSLSSEQRVELPYKHDIVVFIDDLQQYTSIVSSGTDGSGRARNRESEALRDLLERIRGAARQVVVVAACRIEDQVRVQAVFGWLFDSLEVVDLPRFNPDQKVTETARIIDEFKKAGDEQGITVREKDWDGTLGSLVLGLSKKRDQYHTDLSNPARMVLRAMKLLTYVGINGYTGARIRRLCAGVFYDNVLQADERIWRETIDQLKQTQFVNVDVSKNSSELSLKIRSDAYFDKVIDDYIMVGDDPYRFFLDISLLKGVLIGLKDVQGLFSLGDTLTYYDLYEKALEVYDQILRIDSTNVDGWNQRALTLSALERYEEELASYEQALSINPNETYICCNKAVALANLGRYEEALTVLEETLKIDATYARSWRIKGWVLAELKRYQEALAAYQHALDSNPNDVSTWDHQGDLLDRLGQYKEVLAAYSRVQELDPQSAEVWRDKGRVLENLGQYEEALKAYDNALQIDPHFAMVWSDKGSLLFDLNREQEALEAFAHALEINPNLDRTWFLQSISLMVLKRYQEALTSINKSLDIDPEDASNWGMKGWILVSLKQYEDALKALDHALEIDPDDARSWSLKGGTLLKLRRYDEALAAIDRTRTLDINIMFESAENLSKMSKETKLVLLTDLGLEEVEENNSVAWCFRAGFLVSLNRLEEAHSAYNHALELDPHFVRAWVEKSSVLMEMGQYDQAFEAVEQALKLDSEHVDALCNKSSLLSVQKRYDEALEAVDHALRIDPDYSYAWINKGIILQNMKRYEDALQAIDHGLTNYPVNFNAWQQKASILFALGKYEEGFSAIQHLCDLRPDLISEKLLNFLFSDTPVKSEPQIDLNFTSMDANDANAWLYKVSILFVQKRFEEALAADEQALQLNPELALAWITLGDILYIGFKGGEKEALDAYEHAVAIDPNYGQAWLNKGGMLCALGRYKEGVEDINRGFALNPNYASVWTYWAALSHAYTKLKQYEDALAAIEHVLAILQDLPSREQDLPYAWYVKGDVLIKLKRRDEAFRAYERALEMDPDLAKPWQNKWTVFRLWLWKRQRGSKAA